MFPGAWNELSSFRKMCLLRTVRPDKVMPAVLTYVVEQMGRRFVEPPPFDVNGSYEDSSCTTPLVFVLTAGSDPTKMVYAFADEMLRAIDLASVREQVIEHLVDVLPEGSEQVRVTTTPETL